MPLSLTARKKPCGDRCGNKIIDNMHQKHWQVEVFGTLPPIKTRFTRSTTCPHGVEYYIEPTAEQIRILHEAVEAQIHDEE